MNTSVAERTFSSPALQMDETELISVLKSSLYVGAKDESIKLVISYCKAAGLDPMMKPVHIVPMSAKSGRKDTEGKDIYETRDVIMPGVGLYRIQAARASRYAGMSVPEFGPLKTLKYMRTVWVSGEKGKNRPESREEELEYPEWCLVVVKAIGPHGAIYEFPAIEYWIENYATAGKGTDAPNEMWRKRPRGQIIKCAEAQALRKAFPEIVGSQPTAEEMEGKMLDVDIEPLVSLPSGNPSGVKAPQAKAATTDVIDQDMAEVKSKPAETKQALTGKPLNPNQVKLIRAKLEQAALSTTDLLKHFVDGDGVIQDSIEKLDISLINPILSWIRNPPEAG